MCFCIDGTCNYLQFESPVLAEWLQGKAQIIGVRQRPQIKVVFGIDTWSHINVEL